MAAGPASRLYRVLDAIDRLNFRVVYAVLFVVVIVPLAIGWMPSRNEPREYTKGLYKTIEACAETGKPVLLINGWIMSSKGENQPQFEVIVDHMMKRGVKFVMLSLDPITETKAHEICEKYEQYYGRTYGVDWIDFGWRNVYQTGWKIWLDNIESQGLVESLKNEYGQGDLHDAARFPIMYTGGADAQRALELKDFGLVVEVHYGQTIVQLIGLVRHKYLEQGIDIKMAIATITMVTNEMLPYYDSDDLVGVLGGLKSASEYATLIGDGPSSSVHGRMGAYSAAVLFVLFVVVVGNLVALGKRIYERRLARGEA